MVAAVTTVDLKVAAGAAGIGASICAGGKAANSSATGEVMAPCIAIALPIAGRLGQWKNGAVDALNEGNLGRGHQAERETRNINIPEGALLPWGPRLNPATTAPSTSSTPVNAVAVGGEGALHVQQKKERQQERCSPLGCMFHPELTQDGVVAIVSQVLCRPGFTVGASEERRLLKSVRTGRIDIRTMSRILRWLAGERATRDLQRRGIEFVGPIQATASSPYTTGQGMTQLVKEVSQGYKSYLGSCL